MGHHINETYLAGIRDADDGVLNDIFEEFQPGILRYIQSQGGNEAEGKDIFATALTAIYNQVREGKLELRAPFGAYLFSLCKYQWRTVFRKKKRLTEVTSTVESTLTDEEDTPDRQLERTMLHGYIRELFTRLKEDCQTIIRMRWDGRSYSEITAAMGHGSEGYTRKRKHVCHERLVELIKKDPRIREIYHDT